MKIAGIKPLKRQGDNILNELKQAALLFDKIGIPMLDPFLQVHGDLYLKAELSLLKDKDFLFDSWKMGTARLAEGTDLKVIQDELDHMTNLRLNFTNSDSDLIFEAGARYSATLLNNQYDKPDFFSVPLLQRLKLADHSNATKADVFQIVIENIPIPDGKTPWEKIWDFKNDKDNIGKMSGIRVWINDVVKSDSNISEIKDKLEEKLYQYRRSLEIHKIKYNSGILQSLVVGGSQFIENIVKVKFSNIAKGIFSANQERVELMNLELNAPGHELAYVYQAQETFR